MPAGCGGGASRRDRGPWAAPTDPAAGHPELAPRVPQIPGRGPPRAEPGQVPGVSPTPESPAQRRSCRYPAAVPHAAGYRRPTRAPAPRPHRRRSSARWQPPTISCGCPARPDRREIPGGRRLRHPQRRYRRAPPSPIRARPDPRKASRRWTGLPIEHSPTQRRPPRQGHLGFLGCGYRKRRRRLQRRLDRRDVYARTDEEHPVRASFHRLGTRHHRGQLCQRRIIAFGQRLPMHIDDRPVRAVDNGQRRGHRLDEQQRGSRAARRTADRLSQRCRGHKGRDQHDVLNLACCQRITETAALS
jgi:hypothetical protein